MFKWYKKSKPRVKFYPDGSLVYKPSDTVKIIWGLAFIYMLLSLAILLLTVVSYYFIEVL